MRCWSPPPSKCQVHPRFPVDCPVDSPPGSEPMADSDDPEVRSGLSLRSPPLFLSEGQPLRQPPGTANRYQPSTTNRQQPTANHQPPTTNRQPPTANNQPPTTNRQPPTANHQPPTTNRQPPTAKGGELPQKSTAPKSGHDGVVVERSDLDPRVIRGPFLMGVGWGDCRAFHGGCPWGGASCSPKGCLKDRRHRQQSRRQGQRTPSVPPWGGGGGGGHNAGLASGVRACPPVSSWAAARQLAPVWQPPLHNHIPGQRLSQKDHIGPQVGGWAGGFGRGGGVLGPTVRF